MTLTNPFALDENGVEWHHSGGVTPYPAAIAAMEDRVERNIAGRAPELVWLLEHPALYM